MHIEKRGKKKYRVVIKRDNKTYRLNFKDKPTKREIFYKTQEILKKENPNSKTFYYYANQYIKLKENTLSPSTLFDYKKMIETIPDDLLLAKMNFITQTELQSTINILIKTKGARTVQKIKVFIASVFKMFRPEFPVVVFTPKINKKPTYLPKISDISKIMDYAKNSRYETALLLAAFGLRKSEICGLTDDCIFDNYIIIKHVKIKVGKEFIIKDTTKNNDKDPIVYIPKEILDRIREIGLFDGYPDTITTYLYRTQTKLGIPKFSVHKLRHFYPSILHLYGVPDKYAMKQGRWKTSQVLKHIYQDTYDEEMERILSEPHKIITKNLLKD